MHKNSTDRRKVQFAVCKIDHPQKVLILKHVWYHGVDVVLELRRAGDTLSAMSRAQASAVI